MYREFCGCIEASLAKCGATAAAAVFYERNFESQRFEYFHGSHADVRFVITHKGVVPKDDFAAVLKERRFVTAGAIWRSPFLVGGVRSGGRPTMSAKPFVEALTCVMRQGTLSGDSNCFFHCDAH